MRKHSVEPGAIWHHTTVVAVRRDGQVALAADGQVTVGTTMMKGGASKVRALAGGSVLVGFAGSAADALSLVDLFEHKLDQHGKSLQRAAVELVKEWRTDRILRRLEAMMIVADKDTTLLLSGNGDLLAPDDGVVSVGSGSTAALAASRALISHTQLSAETIAREALTIAAGIDIYTNDHITVLTLP